MGTAHDTADGSGRRRGLTPAQWYCLLVGAALLLAGVFGFLADASSVRDVSSAFLSSLVNFNASNCLELSS